MRTIYSDVLCIGAGLAGERVALAAAMEGFHTICLSVVPPRDPKSSSLGISSPDAMALICSVQTKSL